MLTNYQTNEKIEPRKLVLKITQSEPEIKKNLVLKIVPDIKEEICQTESENNKKLVLKITPEIKEEKHPLAIQINYELVKEYYNKRGCTLLSPKEALRGMFSELEYNCSCGNKNCVKKYNNFINTPRCNSKNFNCKSRDKIKNELFEQEKRIEYLKTKNCKMITKEFTKDKHFEFTCSCNDVGKKTYYQFMESSQCSNCDIVDNIREKYLKREAICISDRNDILDKDKEKIFICSCGKICSNKLEEFLKFHYCDTCKKDFIFLKELKRMKYKIDINSTLMLLNNFPTDAKCRIGHDCKIEREKIELGEECCYICDSLGDDSEDDDEDFRMFKKRAEMLGFRIPKNKNYIEGKKTLAICKCNKKFELSTKNLDDGITCCLMCRNFIKFKNLVESYGFELTADEKLYFGSEAGMPALCPRKHQCKVTAKHLRRGDSCCRQCGLINRIETNKKRYDGYDNPSKCPRIKEKMKGTWNKNYGVDNPMKAQSVKNKMKETCNKKYGVDNPMKVQSVKDKVQETWNKNFGGHPMKNQSVKDKVQEIWNKNYGGHPMKNQSVKDKVQETWNKNYGGHPMKNQIVKDKVQETWNKNYGGHPMKIQSVKDKVYKTWIKNYGCHPMKILEFMNKMKKTAFSTKDYKLPSGKIIKIQGYEGFCLDDLFREGYKEEDIITDSLIELNSEIFENILDDVIDNFANNVEEIIFNEEISEISKDKEEMVEEEMVEEEMVEEEMVEEEISNEIMEEMIEENSEILKDKEEIEKMPEIWYFFNGKMRRYFPDIYILSENKIIEVKSTFTLNNALEQNMAKAKACVDMGYNFELRVYNGKGKIIQTIIV